MVNTEEIFQEYCKEALNILYSSKGELSIKLAESLMRNAFAAGKLLGAETALKAVREAIKNDNPN